MHTSSKDDAFFRFVAFSPLRPRYRAGPFQSYRTAGFRPAWNPIEASDRSDRILPGGMQLIRANDFSARHASCDVLTSETSDGYSTSLFDASGCRKCNYFRISFSSSRSYVCTFARNCTNISVVLSLHVRRDRRQPATKRIATKLDETGRNGRST